MSDYIKISDFAVKDSLLTGNPAKLVKGTEIDAEFDAIAVAVATKADTADKLSVFAATTSAELAGVISDETGSGSLVFANTPTLVTPNIGAATGSSLNLGSGALTAGSGTFSGRLSLTGTATTGWNTSVHTIELPNGRNGVLYSDSGYYGALGLVTNGVWGTGGGTDWKYATTNAAVRYEQNGVAGAGTHAWYMAGSGTAGNAISWSTAMTLDASGNLGLGGGANGTYLSFGTSGTAKHYVGTYKQIMGAGSTDDMVINAKSALHLAVNGSTSPAATLDASGNLLVGTSSLTPAGSNVAGASIRPTGYSSQFTGEGGPAIGVNRKANDGDVVSIFQDGTQEGSISVSGTTVSYNGGHLARWSQLPDGSKDETMLKGTVLTNLDAMCEWVKDGVPLANEQLNRMKISDVEGDTNVAGVFVSWTRDEACNTNDMNIAMTGDMIIRIAQGVTVQRGDLLMSAGDGTAKPQDDDIVRAKTIAKVTSTNVSCTYPDGSYCVPCVLMGC